jgi:hypothetical protein
MKEKMNQARYVLVNDMTITMKLKEQPLPMQIPF